MENQKNIEKLRELLSSSGIAMLSTYTKDKGIHTRPMAFQQVEDDGVIWFFTNEYAPKMEEISANNEISLSFTDEHNNNYVVLKANASLSKDPGKMKELFNAEVKAWFPEGLNDPNMALLKADLTVAEYWDGSSNTMVHLFKLAKSLVSGERMEGGKHDKLKL